jgi:ABC-2 type transport system permease protein
MTARPLAAALAVETRKAVASRVLWTTTALLVVGITVLTATLTLAAAAGNEQVVAQLGPLAELAGWDRLVGVAIQIASAAGLLGLGVALSWMFGREFAEGTVTGLFAVQVPRTTLALAKLVVFLAWAIVVAVALVVVLAMAGVALRTGPLDARAVGALVRLLVLMTCSGLLATPAAWAASLGRGLLPGITASIVLVVITQVSVIAGAGAWFPVAAPALWAMDPTAAAWPQLALVAAVPLAFGILTMIAWDRLQLDR